MMRAMRNITDIKKAIILAFISVCLSFAFVDAAFADFETALKNNTMVAYSANETIRNKNREETIQAWKEKFDSYVAGGMNETEALKKSLGEAKTEVEQKVERREQEMDAFEDTYGDDAQEAVEDLMDRTGMSQEDAMAAYRENYKKLHDSDYDKTVQELMAQGYSQEKARREADERIAGQAGEMTNKKNAVCNIPEMRKKYKESCYSCKVVKTLTETFMEACQAAYPKTREAGNKILTICAVLWLAVYALKNVSSFTSLEPSNTVNDLLVFFFKIVVAYVFINVGITVLIKYLVEPILIAGADYGMGIVSSTTGYNVPPEGEFAYAGPELISTKTMNKLFGINKAIDNTVAENLVIGNALVCHANNAGAWVDASFLGLFTLKIPNVWILLCGVAIWCVGFMLTLSISYYILDISFKLGFALIILPVVIALWPFDVTKDKFPKTVSIILKSAAIFAFLAITTSYSIVLISEAMRDLDTFYDKIENDDATWISQTYEITGPYFILIMFAYLYSLKMIGGTINNYVNKFFPDAVFGNASPIHSKATQATDMAKRGAVGLAKPVGKMAGKMALAGAKGVGRGATGLVKAAKRGETGGTTLAGNSMKLAGQMMQFAGRNAVKFGNMKQKLANKIRGAGNKQINKGLEKQNAFRLAAGDLALKAMGTAKDQTMITKGGNKFEQWGKKLEGAGMDVNKVYRDKVRNPAIKKTKQAAKWTAKKGKQAAVWTATKVKKAAYSVQDFAVDKYNLVADFTAEKYHQVVDHVKQTKLYKKSAQIANKAGKVAVYTGNKLVSAYNSVDGATRQAYQVTKRATVNAAYSVQDFAVDKYNLVADFTAEKYHQVVDHVKQTKLYKKSAQIANKAGKVAVYTGNKLVSAYNSVDGATRQAYQVTKRATVNAAYGVVDKANQLGDWTQNTKVYKVADKAVRKTADGAVFVAHTAVNVKDSVKYGYQDVREGFGTTVNMVKDGIKEFKHDVGSYMTRKLVNGYNNVADKTVRPVARTVRGKAHSINQNIYNKYGEKYEIKYGRNNKLETENDGIIDTTPKDNTPKDGDNSGREPTPVETIIVPTPNDVTADPDKQKNIFENVDVLNFKDLKDQQKFMELQNRKISIEAEYQAKISSRRKYYEKIIEDIKKQIEVDEGSRERLSNEVKSREAELDKIVADLSGEKVSKTKMVEQELINLINKGQTGGQQ